MISFLLMFLFNSFFFAFAALVAFFAIWWVSDVLTQHTTVAIKSSHVLAELLTGLFLAFLYPLLATFSIINRKAGLINLFGYVCVAIALSWPLIHLLGMSYSFSFWSISLVLVAFLLHFGLLRLTLPEYFDAPHEFRYRENAGEQ